MFDRKGRQKSAQNGGDVASDSLLAPSLGVFYPDTGAARWITSHLFGSIGRGGEYERNAGPQDGALSQTLALDKPIGLIAQGRDQGYL